MPTQDNAMNNSIQILDLDNNNILTVDLPNGKDHESRVKLYKEWLSENNYSWLDVPLKDYINYLQSDEREQALGTALTNASVNSHMATIRGQYQRILDNNDVHNELYSKASELLTNDGYEPSPANIGVYYTRVIDNLNRSLKPSNSSVKKKSGSDKVDSKHIRLSIEEANKLLQSINTDDSIGLRDKTVIAFLLATGLREFELANTKLENCCQPNIKVLSVLNE